MENYPVTFKEIWTRIVGHYGATKTLRGFYFYGIVLQGNKVNYAHYSQCKETASNYMRDNNDICFGKPSIRYNPNRVMELVQLFEEILNFKERSVFYTVSDNDKMLVIDPAKEWTATRVSSSILANLIKGGESFRGDINSWIDTVKKNRGTQGSHMRATATYLKAIVANRDIYFEKRIGKDMYKDYLLVDFCNSFFNALGEAIPIERITECTNVVLNGSRMKIRALSVALNPRTKQPELHVQYTY